MKRRDILTATLLIAACCPLVMADKKADRKKRRAARKAAAASVAEKAEVETDKKDAKAKKSSNYLRLVRDKDENPTALQTSVVSFSAGRRSKDSAKTTNGVTVDLIGAVHIGDRSYYETLNKLFEDYDVLLYELVAPTGTVPTPALRAQAAGNPISGMQSMTKDMLNLDSQMEFVDYTKKNFVHADMSPSEMAEKMKERGDTGFTVALSAFADIMRQSNAMAKDGKTSKMEEMNPIEMMLSFRNPDKMKLMMAEQFATTGALDTGLGDTLNRMIVSDRNAAVMKILKREIDKGHRKIGIFYGAAHMPDFEERLAKEHGMRPKKPTWLNAWDMTKKAPKKKADDPIDALLNLLGG